MKRFTAARGIIGPALCLLASLACSPRALAQVLPAFSVQPMSQTVNPGTLVTLTADANPATNYQWYENGVAVGSNSPNLPFSSAQAGSFMFYAVASNADGYASSSTAVLTFAVVSAPAFTSAAAVSATIGSAFSFTLTASGLPTSFAAAGLPAGLTLNAATGAITGSPTAAGTFSVALTASNTIGAGTGTLTLVVNPAPPPLPLYAFEQVGQPTSPNSPFYSLTSALKNPTGVAVDHSGKIYVADAGNDTISTPAGVIVAGQAGLVGNVDGPAMTAHFYKPTGIAVDSAGTLYVTDSGNDEIRVISTAGMVTTLAGSPQVAGSTDATGSFASFNAPSGIAVDSGGNLYVADTGNDTIRKITPTGVVTTLAGSAGVAGNADGTGSAASFTSPTGIAVDSAGNIYVADTGNNLIRVITPLGVVSRITGTGATFSAPTGIVVDGSGDLFVTDKGNNILKEIFPGGYTLPLTGWVGALTTQQGIPATVGAGITRYIVPSINIPTALAIDASGDLYWVNSQAGVLNVFESFPYSPVTITSSPQNGYVSGPTTLTVTATGQNVSYAWFGPDPSGSGSTVEVATGPSYVYNPLFLTNNGPYSYTTNGGAFTVQAYNGGSISTVSFGVGVTGPPAYITGLLPSQAVTEGGSLSLYIGATAINDAIYASNTYSWSLNGVPIPGANLATYTIANAQQSDAGAYSVTVTTTYGLARNGTAGAGPNSITSNIDTVTINPATGPQITTQPASVSVIAGASATLSVVASADPAPTYQWSHSGIQIAGATDSSYVIPSASSLDAVCTP
ncbi:MAG TPA: immunoglobulin domain-containing protein [Opitutaceae bacterium]|nr:immunoglobulin domain-containing protein [Opitutaceae bacterium]